VNTTSKERCISI